MTHLWQYEKMKADALYFQADKHCELFRAIIQREEFFKLRDVAESNFRSENSGKLKKTIWRVIQNYIVRESEEGSR